MKAPPLDKNRMTCHSILVVYRKTLKTQEKKSARRQAFLAAALRLFGRHGYHKTTVPQIVKTADSSIGAFYNHFRNKEDVFAAVLDEIGTDMAAALNSGIDAAAGGVFGHMKAAVCALIAFLATHPLHARILIIESAGLGDQLASARRRIIDSHTRSVSNALQMVAEELGGLNPTVAASCWVGSVHEAVFQWLTTPAAQRRSVESLSHDIALFNLRAVGAPVQRLFAEMGHASRSE